MNIDKYWNKRIAGPFFIAAVAAACLSACSSESTESKETLTATPAAAIVSEAKKEQPLTLLTPGGFLLPSLDDVPELKENPIPEFLRNGVEHPIIASLQERLMNLGFMDNDEPTNYFGNVTEAAVKTYQRQNELVQDGIVGPETLNSIMSPSAKYYAVAKGVQGDDITRIQNRLYELGYLANADQVTGSFGDETEAAVMKLQEVNGLNVDGKVGRQTINLLYSEEIRPNYLSYGEKSEVVLACQQRLKTLGYLMTEPDGAYGNDTVAAVKQFQSRNDLVVDGFLGPSTRIALNSSGAQPNGMGLGEQGDSVIKIQQLLNKYGYLSKGNITGYYGEVTEKAVKAFQSRNGLSSDGAVGQMTMNKLTGSGVKSAGTSGGGSANDSGKGGTVKGGSGVSGLLSIARSKLGSPYVWGSKGPGSFDCSGFIYWSLNQAGVRQSYLTSSGWRSVGKYTKISSFGSLQAGDIIVVSGHVGIVAGGGKVIDASSSNGRVVERSLSSWWSNNFICGWRIFG
ncbi:peptidoglycan-binding protein [Clostridium boliviensis]|uniref:Peptidoglycan-binding protein n=1 Tax=Clostridium boliviensis TaxID=318465 RepID=A0ABU4GRX8_9CLOT|nr:peptidoglycan-binding protein [Clostridium boliviensis]MDW2800391.1 peptidoglycan-binding protein [Clostridium boliviensis]